MTTLEEAKAFLKKEGGDGTSLYDHLSDVLLKILVERPENLQDSFEYVSTVVKQQRFVAPPTSANYKGDLSRAKKDSKAHVENWANAALDMLKIKSEEEAGAEKPSGVADLLDEASMFEWAGVGFSKSETFRLSVALQRLAMAEQTASLRFWGKILGIGADFYVAEGELASPTEPEDHSSEEGTAGANRFTYWAMKDDGSYEWVRLPNVKREQILAARLLRRYVHGDLDDQVLGHPPFPGTEKNFLRAQIARISAGTVIAPAEYFQVSEDGDIEPAGEEPAILSAQQLGDLGSWVHFSKELNASYGRMTPMPPQTNSDGEEIPWEGEEFAPPLRPLADDGSSTWRLDRFPGTLIPAVGEFAVARSLVWPGAVSIAVGKKFLNVYVGQGVKFCSVPYQRGLPKPLQPGFGVDSVDADAEAEAKPSIRFEGLTEQKDVLEDPTPADAEEDQ